MIQGQTGTTDAPRTTGTKLSRRIYSEKVVAEALMDSFQAAESRGWQLLTRMTRGRGLPREQMIQIARIFSLLAGIDLPRAFTRRRDLVVKWFDDNFEVLEPFMTVIHLRFDL
jgi:hypothetical protein